VVTESASKSCSSAEVKDEDATIAAVIDAAELKWLEYNISFSRIYEQLGFLAPSLMIIFNGTCRDEQSSNRGQAAGRFTSGRHNGNAEILSSVSSSFEL
jgi:hypothetical protein